jgi:hypothetical protein
MKKISLAAFFAFLAAAAFAQVTYIGITNHNTGSGSNNLFNNYVAVNQQCYIDWEVYADGMTEMEACGFRSSSRLVLRRMGDNDTTSVVAAAPIIVPGICAGKNGNNDHYYVELSAYIGQPGRYSVEIQADLPNMTYPFENASTKSTYNYSCPSAYYLTGTSGPTGNYYTPSGTCTGGPGLSDPVGGQGTDMLAEIFTALKFFTVGEAGTYREMTILNGNFYDLPKGKFQPGNPALPASLNGTNGIPSYGICPIVDAPVISMGGEINIFKRTDCSADVTGAALLYRLYREGTAPPAFIPVALNFKDDCPSNPNGPDGNNFPTGGSCQNTNNILDQRWQTIAGVANLLPASFALADTGLWIIELYTETYQKDCAGTSFTQIGDTAITSFTVNNPLAVGSPCGNVIPVLLSAFTVTPASNSNVLQWTVEEAGNVVSFAVQMSMNGYGFNTLGTVLYNNNRLYQYTDAAYNAKTVFYRLVIYEKDGSISYSPVVRVRNSKGGMKMLVQASPQNILVQLEQFNKGSYQLDVINTAGSLVAKAHVTVAANGNSHIRVPLKSDWSNGVYYAVMRNERGEVIAKTNFYY